MLGLISHVADVAPPGVPYIGEGSWGVPWGSSRTSSRWRALSSNFATPWVAGRRGSTEGNRGRVPALLRRIKRAWPGWSRLKGRRHSNPADQRIKYL